jgi:hypothetical protein
MVAGVACAASLIQVDRRGQAARADLDYDSPATRSGAAAKGFDGLRRENAEWWSDFWAKGIAYMHSGSGQADFVGANYTYFLYLMGSMSRGSFPPRFGGLLWFTDGDMDPLFAMYAGMGEACALAARQQWGTQGIWIPETTFFNGPEKLPEDIAEELQDLMLVRKPWNERSARFDRYANTKNRHNSRWNFRADGDWEHGYYVFQQKSAADGAFGQTTHIPGVAARLGSLAWQRYQFTLDKDWLRERGWPIIKGAAEFYRNFPNLEKDASGVYHINHTNNSESAWNSRDAGYEIPAMHTIFPIAIRASEVLGVESGLRPWWRQIADHLPAARAAANDARPYGAFVYGGPGAIEPIGPEAELKSCFPGFTKLGSFIDGPGIGGAKIFRNRLRLREGPGAIDAEHIAGLSSGIHATLLASAPESVTDQEPISIFNRWPKDWDAAFRLLARGGFVISSAQRGGKIPLAEVVSQLGGPCRLANPWGRAEVTLYRGGRRWWWRRAGACRRRSG